MTTQCIERRRDPPSPKDVSHRYWQPGRRWVHLILPLEITLPEETALPQSVSLTGAS